jgi:6-phosphogluconate dehydrogenase
MTQQYDFGMIGLGVMGSNLLLNMADHHFAAIGFDLKPERSQALEAAASKGTIVKGVNSLEAMVKALKQPRKIMMLVPAGKPVDDVIESLLPILEKGDILIDGGNSFYQDTLQRIQYLQPKGIHFMGMGISGGEMGARTGPSMMPGGDKEAYEYLKPILESIAANAEGLPCVAFMGNGAAGHYVKMVHNGIEYAMMQMISEIYDILHRRAGLSYEKLQEVFATWNSGRLQSFLVEITADIFRTADTESEDPKRLLIEKILDVGAAKGTGKWTSQEGMNLGVAIPSIDAAVAMRHLSSWREVRQTAAGIYNSREMIIEIEQQEIISQAEQALYTGFMLAYMQGLALLTEASVALGMNIRVPDVISVWRSGCIIRSAMLETFAKAYQQSPSLTHLLLDKEIAGLLQQHIPALRRIVGLGIESRIPMLALANAVGYLDACCSERLPMNLVQAQRDYFGAHTYRRTDREGAFHTEWHTGSGW